MNTFLVVVAQALLVGVLALIPGVAWRVSLPKWLPERSVLSPLLGICSLAWWIELVYMFGGPAAVSLASGYGVVTCLLLYHRQQVVEACREFWRELMPSYSVFYVLCLLATSLVVWPAAGPWSTDWEANYLQLNVIWQNARLEKWLLARPPMFAAMAVPYLPFMPPLSAFELSIGAATAAALLCVKYYAQTLSTANLKLISFLLLFAASPFFLVNFTSFVPKFLQATLILGAFMMMRGNAQQYLAPRMAMSSLLVCFAMECHHSTVAYVLGLGLGWLWVGKSQPGHLIRGIALACLMGVLFVGLPELRKISLYGLDEIADYNPSKAMRSAEPAWFVMLMTLECKLVGYQFLVPPYIYLKDISLGTAQALNHYIYWFWFIWLGVLSNTFLFIVAPFLFTWKRVQDFGRYVRAVVPAVLVIGAVIAIMVNCALNPYYISHGNVHCGSSALALALMVLAIAWIVAHPGAARVSQWLTVILGCVPWVAWQCVQFAKVVSLGGYLKSGEVLDDNLDNASLLRIAQEPWGYSLWPWLPVLLTIMLVLLVWLERGWHRQAVAVAEVPSAA